LAQSRKQVNIVAFKKKSTEKFSDAALKFSGKTTRTTNKENLASEGKGKVDTNVPLIGGSPYKKNNGKFSNKDKDADHTNSVNFKHKTISFLDKAQETFELVRSEENENAASFVDSKAEILLNHKVKKIYKKKRQYGDIQKKSKKEAKKLKREIKAEKKLEEKLEQKKNEKNHFSSSQAAFTEENGNNFRNPILEKFRDKNTHGEAIFLDNESNFGLEDVFEKKFFATKDIAAVNLDKKGENFSTNEKNGKFENGTDNGRQKAATEKKESDLGNNNKKFSANKNEQSNSTISKEKQLEKTKSNEKSAKKSKDAEVKKAATLTALSIMLNAKKNMQNNISDMSGQGTGDLLKDGSGGLLKTVTDTLKSLAMLLVKNVGAAILQYIAAAFGTFFIPICVFMIFFILLAGAVSGVGSAISLDSDSGETYSLDVEGDGFLYESLSEDQIDEIIDAIYDNYDDMTSEQETVLRYALSKVGCQYDQAYHGNLSVDIFDCSSLVYRSYLQNGTDISNDGTYTAAEECRQLVDAGRTVDGDMKPGDLIFYGGSDNGRYLGIYHVAVYAGRINGVDKMAEARGPSWGVVYQE
jgi:hypothetical protein